MCMKYKDSVGDPTYTRIMDLGPLKQGLHRSCPIPARSRDESTTHSRFVHSLRLLTLDLQNEGVELECLRLNGNFQNEI